MSHFCALKPDRSENGVNARFSPIRRVLLYISPSSSCSNHFLSSILLHPPLPLNHNASFLFLLPFFFFFTPIMNPPQESADIRQASAFLTSALSSCSSIRSFPVKWQSIRLKLQRLHSSLASAAISGDSVTDSSLSELIQRISATAKETVLLACRCNGDESHSGGKLFLKSDLDVMAAKLEIHIKRLDEIYASGFLFNSKAIILSKPGAGASREDMRFFARDLFSRLRVGNMEMKARALSSINEILQEDDKYVRIVAVETVDSLGILVNLLEFRDVGIQEQSLKAVLVVSAFESYRSMLAMAGVIPPLIQILQHGSGMSAKEGAAQALKQMTENCNNSWLVSSQGGVSALLNICKEEGSSSKLVSLSCGALRNISCVNEIKRFMVDEGAISVFLKLMKSKEEVAQNQATEFLFKLASETEDEAIKHQVVESLLSLMNPNSLCSSKLREITLRAIEGFCFTSADAVKHLLNSGFLDRILFLLRHGEILDQESAMKAAHRFSGISEEVKKAMGDMGFMTELVRMLEAGSFEARETAAETLCGLMAIQKNRRRLIREEESVDRVLQLLNLEDGKSEQLKKLLLSALISLTDSNGGRRKVVNSIYVRNLEKLAETNVAEAKKIMKRIAGNSFRSIISGIWGYR